MNRNLMSGLSGLVLLALVSILSAKEIPTSKPERLGFSSDRLDNITEFMNRKVADGTMVGGMGLIARGGKVIYEQTYGMADREAERVMEEDAIYRIYSMTKPITGVALMILYE